MSNKIGRFEILSEIAHSKIGCVYKATDSENGQTVALKTLRLDAIGEHVHEMVQRLVQEAQGTGSLSSHNIAQLFGVDEIDGQFCAALEYVQGNSVATILARNEGFSIWDVKDIARQACQALDHAHSRKIFHYSLEPDKLVSQWDGMVKILGFGVSAMSIPSAELHGEVPKVLCYMSPEQVRGEAVDARSNLFSLGAILYEMLTEQKAFDGETEEQVKRQILEETPLAPHQVNNKVTLDVSNVVMKALSKSPNDRYQNGQELVTDLEGRKEATVVAGAKKAAPAAKKTTGPARGLNIPAKDAATASAPAPVASEPRAAAAAAGWGGTGAGSPGAEAPRTPGLDSSDQFINNCVKASIEAATQSGARMSAAPVEEEQLQTGFKVDPAMDENRAVKAPSRSFSELTELPPLKEVNVAPAPSATDAAPNASAPPPPPAPPDKPKVQPRVVAKKAVQEIKKTPPQLFLYSVAGAVVLILLIVGGIAYKIHSDNSGDEDGGRAARSEQPAPVEKAPAPSRPAPVQAAPAETASEPDVITIKSKPATPKRVKAPAATIIVPGTISVSSNPSGAQILLDGQSDPTWVTPVELTGVEPGRHTVTLSKPGFAPETKTIEVASRSKFGLVIELAAITAGLSVTSEPAGAKVILDGKDLGRVTPLQLSVDKPGNHTILVRKEGYLEESTTLNLQAGQSSHYAPSLRKLGQTDDIKIKKFLGGQPDGTGAVNVKVEPKGAQVAVNRRIVDKPSPVLFYLNPGTYVIDVTESGYKSIHKVINVEKGGKVSIEETMERQ